MRPYAALLLAGVSCAGPATPDPAGDPRALVSPELGPSSSTSAPPPTVLPPPSAPTAPEPAPGSQRAHYAAPPPKTIAEAFGNPDQLFPVGFEDVSLDWRAADLVAARPWVVNEGRLAPPLSYLYREAAYDAGTGRGDNPWMIANSVFGAVEYHFQRDASGSPVGPLHKVVFLFDVSLPKDAVQQLQRAASDKWGPCQTRPDEFAINRDLCTQGPADVVLHYSPGGAIAESLEIISRSTPSF